MTEYEIPEAAVAQANAAFWDEKNFGRGMAVALQAALPLIDADRREKGWLIIEDREKAVEALMAVFGGVRGTRLPDLAGRCLNALSALGGTNDG